RRHGATPPVPTPSHRTATRHTTALPAGLATRYTYDGQNRLESVAIPSAFPATYTYYPDDLLHTVTYPNGVVATHVYDKADRLKSLTNSKRAVDVSSYAYEY